MGETQHRPRSDADLVVETQGAVTRLRLNRPERLNALTLALLTDIHRRVVEIAHTGTCRCLVITGTGRGFCAGQSLEEVREAANLGDRVRTILQQGYLPLVSALVGLELPVVAAINGVTAGSGLSLALACDLRVASDEATFTCAFSRVGLVPDAGATLLLPRAVGWSAAADLALTGRRVDADEALHLGLVHRVFPAATFAAGAAAAAAELAAGPTRALGLTKRALSRSWTASLEEQLAIETDLQVEASGTADGREGIAAFVAGRRPSFRGS